MCSQCFCVEYWSSPTVYQICPSLPQSNSCLPVCVWLKPGVCLLGTNWGYYDQPQHLCSQDGSGSANLKHAQHVNDIQEVEWAYPCSSPDTEMMDLWWFISLSGRGRAVYIFGRGDSNARCGISFLPCHIHQEAHSLLVQSNYCNTPLQWAFSQPG